MTEDDIIERLLAIQKKYYDYFYLSGTIIIDCVEFDFLEEPRIKIRQGIIPDDLKADLQKLE